MTSNEIPDNLSNGDGEEVLPEPTGAAYVTITKTENGVTFRASVPAKESRRMLDTTDFVCGVVASLLAPLAMAEALGVGGSDLPWQVRITCIFLAAIMPLAVYWVAGHKS